MESMFQSPRERTSNLFSRLRGPPAATSSVSQSSSSCCHTVGTVGKLHKMMEMIRALLCKTGEMVIPDDQVKLWLDDLRDVAFDAEDLLEEIEYKLLQSSTEKVSDSLVTHPCAPLHDASFQQQIVAKIEAIKDQFDEIYECRCKLELRPEDGERRRESPLEGIRKMPPSSSLVDQRCVKGREDDMREVIHRLRSDDDEEGRHCNENNVRVLSIVGMGGVGKTTLAKLVFHDDAVEKHFEKRLWVYVSETFDVTQLTNQILGALGETPSELGGFSSLSVTLSEKLEGKRFLLVLDDVWNESQEQWDALWPCLSRAAEGSRVLITTRSEMTSRISGVSEGNMYHLNCLSPAVCWSLFEQRAFRGRSSSDHPHLVSIGRQIVKKCKGLPLTVKMLAGLLFTVFSVESWDDILRGDLWDLLETKDNIILSYHRLPPPTKPCFAYCAIFPKEHEFHREILVLLWMAQGYVPSTPTKSMEDMGREYLQYLLQCSLFQHRSGDTLKMHDLIHDLALSVSSTVGERIKLEGGRVYPIISRKARHLCFYGEADTRTLLLLRKSHYPLQHLRTFYMTTKSLGGSISFKDLDNMFLCMKYLRVLNLCDEEMTELPDSIGNLTLLRYLGISAGKLRVLPESLGNLLNLQTLEVKRARSLRLLPKCLKDLNLRYLKLHKF